MHYFAEASVRLQDFVMCGRQIGGLVKISADLLGYSLYDTFPFTLVFVDHTDMLKLMESIEVFIFRVKILICDSNFILIDENK